MDNEFPTDWHRQAYLDALERELEGARRLRSNGEAMVAQATQVEENAARELARVKKTERRPADSPDKESR